MSTPTSGSAFSYRDEEALVRHLVGDLERKLAGRHESRILRIIPSDHCHLGVLGPRDPIIVQPEPLEPAEEAPPAGEGTEPVDNASPQAPPQTDEEPGESATGAAEP